VLILRPSLYAEGSAKDINVVLASLEKKMAGVKSIETDFIQEKKMAVFDKKIILKGKIFIQEPDLFSWHTEEPVRYVMLIKADMIKQWDEDSRQVQVLNISRNPAFSIAINQMKVWFEGEYSKLLTDYDANVVSEEPVVLEFMPKKSAGAYNIIKKVRLTFREDERYIARIDIIEKNEDLSSLSFMNTKLNTPIEPSNWELK
jgi:outer membrane lipoprotein-sorting protein